MKSQTLSSLFDEVSHDLKSPLANIQANIGIIRKRLTPSEREKIEKHLAKIDTKVKEINEVFTKLRNDLQKSTP